MTYKWLSSDTCLYHVSSTFSLTQHWSGEHHQVKVASSFQGVYSAAESTWPSGCFQLCWNKEFASDANPQNSKEPPMMGSDISQPDFCHCLKMLKLTLKNVKVLSRVTSKSRLLPTPNPWRYVLKDVCVSGCYRATSSSSLSKNWKATQGGDCLITAKNTLRCFWSVSLFCLSSSWRSSFQWARPAAVIFMTQPHFHHRTSFSRAFFWISVCCWWCSPLIWSWMRIIISALFGLGLVLP